MNTQSRFRRRAWLAASSLVCLVVATTGEAVLHAAEREEADEARARFERVAPLIDESTLVVLSIDLARAEFPDPGQIMRQLRSAGLSALVLPDRTEDDEERVRAALQQMSERLESLQAAVGGQRVYTIAGLPRSRSERPFTFFTEANDELDQQRFLEWFERLVPDPQLHEREGMVVLSSGDRSPASAEADAVASRQELEEAFQAVARFPVQVLLLPPDHLRRTMLELMPRVPKAWGGGPSELWVEGVRWAAIGFDPAEREAELVVQSASDEAAARLGTHVEALARDPETLAPELAERVPLKPLVAALRDRLEIEDRDARLIGRLEGEASYELGATLLFAAAFGMQEHVHGTDNGDKFKQILLAMHNYHDVHGALPPPNEGRDEAGRANLSWRVYLLPFLDEAELYQQFRLDEAWDSPHNKALIDRMPQIYASWQWDVPAGHTTFLAPVGEDTVFGGAEATRFQDIRDGLSNTVAVVEVAAERAVPWTAPDDFAFDPQDPSAGLRAAADGTFLAGIVDGSVHRLRKDAPGEMLLRVFQKGEGKVIDWDVLR